MARYKNSEINSYVTDKITMLQSEFRIWPTKDEIAHLRELKTEVAVDNYVRVLYEKYLDDGK